MCPVVAQFGHVAMSSLRYVALTIEPVETPYLPRIQSEDLLLPARVGFAVLVYICFLVCWGLCVKTLGKYVRVNKV